MSMLQSLVAIALVIGIGAFVATHRRTSATCSNARSDDGRLGAALPIAPRGPATAAQLLQAVERLRAEHAQWPKLLSTLNPEQREDLAGSLHAIRGPHMFDPRTALGVIEQGARSVPPTAPADVALAAAVQSMNKVVAFGR